MTDEIFHVKPALSASAHVNAARLGLMTNQALRDPDGFWLEQARRLDWVRAPTLAGGGDFTGEVRLSWFSDGVLNASVNCLDRHLHDGGRTALIWQGEAEDDVRRVSFQALHEAVCRLANVLKGLGVRRGDRVATYLPMVVESVVAMLACARIGAVHVVMFAGFSAAGVANRLRDSGAVLLVTADEGRRGGRRIALKALADAALDLLDAEDGGSPVRQVLVVPVTGALVPMRPGRDLDYAALVAAASPDCAPEPMAAEDPLLILYTSGSTGAPKGLLHTTGGYLLWASLTQEIVFDHRAGDVFWCTADLGWVTGHSYVVYGPLANGGTSLLFEGTPSWPEPGRWWRVIDKHRVNVFYTAPTAIRALMREDRAVLAASSRDSLRVLGSVGEPINPEAWLWFHEAVGGGRCPLVDSWWQTETGGIMIAPLPGAVAQKPGSATLPLPGVCAVLVGADGVVLEGPTPDGEADGRLCIARSWPGQARTIWGDHARYVQTYFSAFPGLYFSGDGARRDADGYYWITGRVDDVINVSGHRIGSAEVEAAIGSHAAVAESAVIGVPHDLKGQSLMAFVILRGGNAPPGLEAELARHVGHMLGRYAVPDRVLLVADLPKTRSGKIMRRILRKVATGEHDQLGDVSTLADPTVVDALVMRVGNPVGR